MKPNAIKEDEIDAKENPIQIEYGKGTGHLGSVAEKLNDFRTEDFEILKGEESYSIFCINDGQDVFDGTLEECKNRISQEQERFDVLSSSNSRRSTHELDAEENPIQMEDVIDDFSLTQNDIGSPRYYGDKSESEIEYPDYTNPFTEALLDEIDGRLGNKVNQSPTLYMETKDFGIFKTKDHEDNYSISCSYYGLEIFEGTLEECKNRIVQEQEEFDALRAFKKKEDKEFYGQKHDSSIEPIKKVAVKTSSNINLNKTIEMEKKQEQTTETTKGDMIAFREEKGKDIKQAKITSTDGDEFGIEYWDRDKKEKVDGYVPKNNDTIRKMNPGQKFDLRELRFPIWGKGIEELKKEFPQLLSGRKTSLIEGMTRTNKETNQPESFDGKLSLSRYENGKPKLNLYEKQEKLEIKDEMMGVKFTSEMKEELSKRGHLGLVEGFQKKGEKFDAYVSIDKDTNLVAFMPKSSIKIQDTLKGKKLTEEEKASLKKGEAVKIEGMKSTKGETFSAIVRVNAAKQTISFSKPDAHKIAEKHSEKHVKAKRMKV